MSIINALNIPPGYTTTPLNTVRSSRIIYAYTNTHEVRVARDVYLSWAKQAADLITKDAVDEMMVTRQLPLEVISGLEKSIDKWIVDDMAPQWAGAMYLGSAVMIKAFERYLGRSLGETPKGHRLIEAIIRESENVRIGKKSLSVPANLKAMVEDYYSGEFNPGFATDFPAVSENLTAWINTRGAAEAFRYKEAQLKTWQTILQRGIVEQGLNGTDIAAQLYESTGLTPLQEVTVERHRAALIKEGVSKSAAQKSAAKYAKTIRKRRAVSIGRTELANAYNGSRHITVTDFVDRQVIHEEIIKRWYSAVDERVCPLCGDLHGTTVALRETWVRVDGKTAKETVTGEHPPAHSKCRCVTLYEILSRTAA